MALTNSATLAGRMACWDCGLLMDLLWVHDLVACGIACIDGSDKPLNIGWKIQRPFRMAVEVACLFPWFWSQYHFIVIK